MRSRLRLEHSLLAAGMVATSASSLRFIGGAVGVGELILVVWLVHVWISSSTRRAGSADLEKKQGLRRFWVVVFPAMLVGMFARVAFGIDALDSGRDALAYAFVALISIAMCRRYDSREMIIIAGAVVRWIGLFVGAQVLVAFVLGGGPDLWWFGPRFRGYSQDPNQLGFYILALPFLAAWMQSRTFGGVESTSTVRRLLFVGLVAVCVSVALLTQSDSLLVAWVIGGLAMYLRYYVGSLARPVRGYWRGAVSLLIAPAVVLALVIANSGSLAGAIAQSADEIIVKDNQASTRIALWQSAIEAVYDSPLVGWGPGSYAGSSGPYGGFEAHNSYLQLATNSGIIGLVALLVLMLSVLAAAWKSGSPPLVGATVAVMALMFFHHALRHPVFWFTLCALMSMASFSILERRGVSGAGTEP